MKFNYKKKEFFVYFEQKSLISYMFCKYFLPGHGMSFHSLNVIFCKQQFYFNEVQHQFSVQALRDCAFGVVCKTLLPNRRSPRFPTTLFPRHFMLWHSAFRSMMHFNLCEGYKVCAQIHVFTCGHPVVPAPFIEKTVLSALSCPCICQRSVKHICGGIFLDPLFCSTDTLVIISV